MAFASLRCASAASRAAIAAVSAGSASPASQTPWASASTSPADGKARAWAMPCDAMEAAAAPSEPCRKLRRSMAVLWRRVWGRLSRMRPVVLPGPPRAPPPRQAAAAARMLGRPAGEAGQGNHMKQWSIALVAAALALACTWAHAAAPVPVEAFAEADRITSPRISPDGKHVAVSANVGEGNHAIVVYRVEGMQQTALLKLPRYEQPVDMYWASDTRLLVAKGRLIGSREKPLATGEIIATDFDGRNQLYVFGYQVRKTGIDRGFGIIESLPPVRNGHFYMRHRTTNSRRSMLYDMDAERG